MSHLAVSEVFAEITQYSSLALLKLVTIFSYFQGFSSATLPSNILGWSEEESMHYCFQFYVQVAIDYNERVGMIETLISPVKCKIVVR